MNFFKISWRHHVQQCLGLIITAPCRLIAGNINNILQRHVSDWRLRQAPPDPIGLRRRRQSLIGFMQGAWMKNTLCALRTQ